ncbi:hypothetical protein M2323_002933 [Rhodoblastus acidophilus]|uniref:hypothetical protein n=1 Tax=Rhodoblastus acidophilus TaxID=1074 RepID=UPI002224007D|nr:hypothetical protein [Rhodoblastus acidophilus]MCW2284940.1 hypothetical protein [Rhodoblastus acidophilus]MCW2333996.1 hypothetical protein [Rhodoblastus acidophilus]
MTAHALAARAGAVVHARDMLKRIMPFTDWWEPDRPTFSRAAIWLAIVNEWTALAAFTPAEARAVAERLEVPLARATIAAKQH